MSLTQGRVGRRSRRASGPALGACSPETACKPRSAEHTPEGAVFSFPPHMLASLFLGRETMRNGMTPSRNDLNQSVHCRQGSLMSIGPLSASARSLFSPKELSSALNRTVMKCLRGTGRSCEPSAHAKQDRRAEGRGPDWLCRARPTQLEPLPAVAGQAVWSGRGGWSDGLSGSGSGEPSCQSPGRVSCSAWYKTKGYVVISPK